MRLTNWGGGGGEELKSQSPIGVYTLAPNCACAHKIGYVCVLVHITECARWSTEQVEYRTGGVQNRWSTEQVEY